MATKYYVVVNGGSASNNSTVNTAPDGSGSAGPVINANGDTLDLNGSDYLLDNASYAPVSVTNSGPGGTVIVQTAINVPMVVQSAASVSMNGNAVVGPGVLVLASGGSLNDSEVQVNSGGILVLQYGTVVPSNLVIDVDSASLAVNQGAIGTVTINGPMLAMPDAVLQTAGGNYVEVTSACVISTQSWGSSSFSRSGSLPADAVISDFFYLGGAYARPSNSIVELGQTCGSPTYPTVGTYSGGTDTNAVSAALATLMSGTFSASASFFANSPTNTNAIQIGGHNVEDGSTLVGLATGGNAIPATLTGTQATALSVAASASGSAAAVCEQFQFSGGFVLAQSVPAPAATNQVNCQGRAFNSSGAAQEGVIVEFELLPSTSAASGLLFTPGELARAITGSDGGYNRSLLQQGTYQGRAVDDAGTGDWSAPFTVVAPTNGGSFLVPAIWARSANG